MKRGHSSIEKLGVQELVGHLFESGATYEQIIGQVKQATNTPLSMGALSRYHTTWASAQRQLELAAQETEAILKVLQAKPEANMAEAGMGVLLGKLVRRFAAAQENLENVPLDKLAHLLVKVFRARQTGQALGIQEKRLELLKTKVQAVADDVAKTAKAAGLSKEKVNEIREKVYGLAPVTA